MLDNLHVRIFLAENMVLPADSWNSRDVCSSYWRFYWNDDRGASLELPRPGESRPERFLLEPGRGYVIPAGVMFSCSNECDVRHFYIHFDVAGIYGEALQAIFGRPFWVDDSSIPQAVGRVKGYVPWRDAGCAVPSPPDFERISLPALCRAKSLLMTSLAVHLESIPEQQLALYADAVSNSGQLQPALDFIYGHLSDELSNVQLADICHISEPYFMSLFRARIGMPPGRYITSRRIATASQLLLFSEQSIETIAQQTGFSNRYYFSRVFSQYAGASPAAFRKARRV